MSMSGKVCACPETLAGYRNNKQTLACESPVSGYKEHSPIAGNWLQCKRLEQLRDAHGETVNELRVVKKKQCAVGTLLPDIGLVTIEGTVGPHWRYFGISRNGKNYLLPEEAVYLVESSCLEILHCDLPLSTEHLYSWMTGLIRLGVYLTYSHLTRLGYVVRRFEGESGVTNYERKLQLDQHLPGKKRKIYSKTKNEKKLKLHSMSEKDVTVTYSNKLSRDIPMDDEISEPCMYSSISGGIAYPDANHCEANDLSNRPCDSSPDCRTTIMDASEEEICRIHLETVMSLLTEPYSEDPVRHIYNHTMRNICEYLDSEYYSFKSGSRHDGMTPTLWPEKPETADIEADKAFGLHVPENASKLAEARDWTEYKNIVNSIHVSAEAPTSYLTKDNPRPLTMPGSCHSVSEIYNKLQIIQTVPNLKFGTDSSYVISFDVYTPAQKASFKKSGWQLPAYRVVVMEDGSAPPELCDVVKMQCSDGVPILWAIGDGGDVQFYSFQHVTIPVDENNGR